MTRSDEVSDEMLMALADGELNELDAQCLQSQVNSNPDLAARYADFVETRALMRNAFPAEPVPDRLVAAVLQGGPAQSRIAPFRKKALAAPIWGMALAASIVLAVGSFWAGQSMAPQEADNGSVALATANVPTGGEVRLADGSTARVLASYDTDLGLCRMIAQEAFRHIACRDGQTGDWTLALSVQGGDTDSFLPASDIAVALIERLLDDIAAGPPLDAAAETRALQP